MTAARYIGTAAAALLAMSTVAVPAALAAKRSCVLAGGEATMITGDLARFMARAALKNSISGMGAKPAGKVKLQCKPATLSVHCIARQRACK